MNEANNNTVFSSPAVMSDGDGGWQPCPPLLTEEEAIRYLRLDIDGPTKPENTLRYYRNKKKLQGTRVGKQLRYRRKSLDDFLEKMT